MPQIAYTAHNDFRFEYVRTDAKRRFVVVKRVDGMPAYVCGTFGSMKSAEKRADYLNRVEKASNPQAHVQSLASNEQRPFGWSL